LDFLRKNITHLIVIGVVALIFAGTLMFERAKITATEVQAGELAVAATAEAAAGEAEEAEKDTGSSPLKALAAALALGMGALGTGYAQSRIGAAGVGAMAEKPEMSTMCIVMLAIPETIVILGFVVAAMIVMF
jgi:V/A-type H+-transporting ATPase subunit K